MRPRLAGLLCALGLGPAAVAGTPPDIWTSPKIPAEDPGALFAKLDQAAAGLPAQLKPAVQFQKTLLQIRAGNNESAWRADLERAARNTAEDGVSVALREFAKYWLARLSVQQIDKALRKYYAEAVRFPDTLAEVKKNIPEATAADPWGQPWVYRPRPPAGLAKLTKQRYQLGPTRWPELSTFAEAVKSAPSARTWKIMLRDMGGNKVLEIRFSDGKSAALQPGGHAADVTLAYIGDGWALFTDTERLFTATF